MQNAAKRQVIARIKRQILLTMKLMAVFLFVLALHVTARSTAQVTLREKKASLEKVLQQIRQQSGYDLVYDRLLLAKKSQPVNIDVKNVPLEQALALAFENQPLTYEIVDRIISVKERLNVPEKKQESRAGENPAPPLTTVHGRITNENGEPVVGVSINVKGGKTIGVTDNNGEFTLTNVPDNATLVFSAVTIETMEVRLNGRSELTLNAKIKTNELDEVVVSKGYYTIAQKLNTGTVTKVKGDDIRKQPVSDPILALEGRVAGLYISQTSGIPGANSSVRLRGTNSISSGSDPLYIVDGVPYGARSLTSSDLGGTPVNSPRNNVYGAPIPGLGLSPFNSLATEDIESIEVLKDADATAIYGSRGANGVILITTKKGKAGKINIDLNVSSGIGTVSRTLDLLSTPQFLQMRRQALKNDNITPSVSNGDYDLVSWDTTRNTDWQKYLIGNTAHYKTIQGTITGGSTNAQYMVGANYSKQTTVYPVEFGDEKASMFLSLSPSSADQRFQSQLSLQYVYDRNKLPQSDMSSGTLIAPDAPALYDANGAYNWQGNTWTNPMAIALRTTEAASNNLIGSLNLSYKILPGLVLKGNIGYTRSEMNQNNIRPLASFIQTTTSLAARQNNFATTTTNSLITEPQLIFFRKMNKSVLDILVGATFQKNVFSTLAQFSSNYPSDEQIRNIQAAGTISVSGFSKIDYRYTALFGRVGYNWADKYLLNLTIRRDGSSRFGPGSQFGNFGAIGAAYVFSEEPFVKKTFPFLSFGKLKGSYGIVGNDQIADYQYLSSYSFYTSSTYQNTSTLTPNRIANPYYGWEQIKKLEASISLGLVNDRVFFNLNYYSNRTENQLISQALSSVSGFLTIQQNLPAVIQNSGFEFELNTQNFKKDKFSWSTSINLTIPKNKLLAFPDLANNTTYRNGFVVGKSIYVQSRYHYTGVDPTTGLYTFQDVNSDGLLNSADQQLYAEVSQKFFGGVQNTFKFKGLQLDVFVQFVKQTGFNFRNGNGFNPPGIFNQQQPTFVLDAWQKPGDQTDIQRYTSSFFTTAGIAYTNMQSSDGAISDASFVRLKNVAISYQLPGNRLSKIKLKNLRIFLNAQNIFTITSFRGVDPENQTVIGMPPLRMISTGLQIGL